jgi:hypothetical protein
MRDAIRAYRSIVLIEFSPFDSRHRRDFNEAANDAQNPLTIRHEDHVDFVVRANDTVRITLIDRRNHHLFQPPLYEVATVVLPQGYIVVGT